MKLTNIPHSAPAWVAVVCGLLYLAHGVGTLQPKLDEEGCPVGWKSSQFRTWEPIDYPDWYVAAARESSPTIDLPFHRALLRTYCKVGG